MKSEIAVSALLLSLAASAQQSTPPISRGATPSNPFRTPTGQEPLSEPVLTPLHLLPSDPELGERLGSRSQVGVDLRSQVIGQDLQFMTDAAQTGMTEAEIGRLARTNGQSDAVKQFGKRLVDDHQRAIRHLALVAGRLGVKLPSEPDAVQKQHIVAMASLRGREFDYAFVRHIIVGHQSSCGRSKHELAGIEIRRVGAGQTST